MLWFIIAAVCITASLHSLIDGQHPNAFSFLIAAITIPMALWYLSRSARAHEAGVKQTQELSVAVQNMQLPPDDATLEQHRANVFLPPN